MTEIINTIAHYVGWAVISLGALSAVIMVAGQLALYILHDAENLTNFTVWYVKYRSKNHPAKPIEDPYAGLDEEQ